MSTTPQKEPRSTCPSLQGRRRPRQEPPKRRARASPTKRGARTAGPGRFSRAGVQLTKAGVAFGDAFKALGQARGSAGHGAAGVERQGAVPHRRHWIREPGQSGRRHGRRRGLPEVIRPGTVVESVTVPSGVPAQPVGLAVAVSGAGDARGTRTRRRAAGREH